MDAQRPQRERCRLSRGNRVIETSVDGFQISSEYSVGDPSDCRGRISESECDVDRANIAMVVSDKLGTPASCRPSRNPRSQERAADFHYIRSFALENGAQRAGRGEEVVAGTGRHRCALDVVDFGTVPPLHRVAVRRQDDHVFDVRIAGKPVRLG